MNNIKILLGEASVNYTDEQITLFYEIAKAEVETYCGRALDTELTYTAERIAALKLLRANSEGLSGQSFSGVSESYIDGYPADIMAMLNRKRKVKFL